MTEKTFSVKRWTEQLVDIGRGVVVAHEIRGVISLHPDDVFWTRSEGSKPMPAYAQSEVLVASGALLSPLPVEELIRRWREALDLPDPIGESTTPPGGDRAHAQEGGE